MDVATVSGEQPAFLGCYSNGWIWPEADLDWVKTLLLFFDGIALFMPQSLVNKVVETDPYLAQPLAARGLLTNLDPDEILDQETSQIIISIVDRLVTANPSAVHRMGFEIERWEFDLTSSHLGAFANPAGVQRVLNELRNRGLAGSLDPEGLFKIDPNMRSGILQACAQVISMKCRKSGTDLALFSSPRDPHGHLTYHDPVESWSSIIVQDVAAVGADLTAVPLDDILDFRAEHGAEYRAYLRKLRALAREIEVLGDNADDILRARAQEFDDLAADLRRRTKSAFRRRAMSVVVTMAATSWTVHTGDPMGAALAAAAGLMGLTPSPDVPPAYSYLFNVAELSRHHDPDQPGIFIRHNRPYGRIIGRS
jgi:hypothetical protein